MSGWVHGQMGVAWTGGSGVELSDVGMEQWVLGGMDGCVQVSMRGIWGVKVGYLDG